MPRARAVLLVAALGAWVLPAAAEPDAPEAFVTQRLRIGEYQAKQVVDALQSLAAARQEQRDVNALIAGTRQAYFASVPGSRERAQIGRQFADLLLAKDQYFFAQLLTQGTGERGQRHVGGMQTLMGGALDGGIPAAVRGDFIDWVDAVRASMGVRSPDDLVIAPPQRDLERALRANMAAYERYAARRDQHEHEAHARQQRVAAQRAALTPAGREALAGSETGVFDPRDDVVSAARLSAELDALLGALWKARQGVLRCKYGPHGIHDSGEPLYEWHRFWLGSAPAGIDALLAADPAGRLGPLATRDALAACPATRTAAQTAVQSLAPKPPTTAEKIESLDAQRKARVEEAGEQLRQRYCPGLTDQLARARAALDTARRPSPSLQRRLEHAQAEYDRRRCGDS
ncbi:hypothetical protein [Inhella proteolytica]|uniref:Uncharacterized protein n=1 Tax=Inhella proteolytica TaxID=2795029 RepID=A0A931NHP1_9BURK|nr:hypothetical protein [Inhella proteolytica]MBH9577264.1 hypothetical protein [Inhella proteolytica]